jgi:ribosome recycling factor
MTFDIKIFDKKMQASMDVLSKEFSGIRAGRASASLLEPIKVDAYGSFVPINQVAAINVPEPRLITVSVWDKAMIKAVEKAIRESNLGLNPAIDGQLIRVPLPDLNEQRRQELAKIAAKYSEETKISIRNVRREAMDHLKKLEKDKHISEDDQKKFSDNVQELTDKYIKNVDEALSAKQKDIMMV